MHVVIRRFDGVRSPKSAIQRAETGQGYLMKSCPGFRGYYIFDAGSGTIGSITLFETREQALAAHEKAMAWVHESLSDLIDGEPTVTAGDIVSLIEPAAPPG